jgi:hypothetical protein
MHYADDQQHDERQDIMSDYINILLAKQHRADMYREREAQRLAKLARGERPHHQWNIRPLARSFQMAMIEVGRGMALRGLWVSRHKTQPQTVSADADMLVPDCC